MTEAYEPLPEAQFARWMAALTLARVMELTGSLTLLLTEYQQLVRTATGDNDPLTSRLLREIAAFKEPLLRFGLLDDGTYRTMTEIHDFVASRSDLAQRLPG